MSDIKFVRTNINEQIPLIKYIGKEFELTNIQRYIPIFSDFDSFKKIYEKKYKILNSKFVIRRLNTQIIEDDVNLFENQNRKYIGEIKKNHKYSKNYKKDVFIKMNSILEPMCYMMGYYNNFTRENYLLPSIKKKKFGKYTLNKINSKNNTAYIDSFSTYLLSQLVEKELCCAFPLYYGTFLGIKKKFFFNITEEYDSIKNNDWFIKGLYNNNYSVHCNKVEYKKEEYNYLENLDNYDSDKEDEYPIVNIQCLNGEKYSNDPSLFYDINEKNNDIDNMSDIDLYQDISTISDDETSEKIEVSNKKYLEEYYLEMNDTPVSLTFMESFENTIEYLCKTNISEEEWICHLFQICFGLSIAQKEFDFYHNDLHTGNIMYKNTTSTHIYYQVNNIFYRIPTFGKIMKIIDFGRAIFTIKNKTYFSDVFEYDGEAYGQYTYPEKDFNKKKVVPNKSFDLSRLATTLLDDIPNINSKNTNMKDLQKILLKWVTDKYGKDVRRFDEFDLYKIIARRMDNAVPVEQLQEYVFKKYIVSKDLVKNEKIYKL